MPPSCQRPPSGTTQADVGDRRPTARTPRTPSPRGRRRGLEQPLAVPEQHRDDGHVELVEQPGPQVLLHGGGAAAEPDVPAAARRGPGRARPRCRRSRSGTSCRRPSGRPAGWWVRTKTSWWNGGSSPHQPRHSSSPRAADRAEHVAAHDRGADAVVAARPNRRRSTSARVGGEDPLVQLLAADAERVLLALVGSGAVAVEEIEKLCTRSSVMQGGRRRARQLIGPGGTGGTLAVPVAVPYTGSPGAADPATGVPRNLLRGSALPW